MPPDICGIEQLQVRYCHRLDRSSAAEVAALFADDGILRPRFDGSYVVRGRDEIRGWYEHYHQQVRGSVRHLRHVTSSLEILARGGIVTCVSNMTATFIANADNKARTVHGAYEDTVTLVDGQWLFTERQIDTFYVVTEGDVKEHFEPLDYRAPSTGA